VTDHAAVLNDVLRGLLEEPALVNDPKWDAVAVVANVTDESTQLNAYRYTGDGPPAPTPLNDPQHFDRFDALRDAAGEKWQVCIVKIDRDSRKGIANFVYGDDAELWTINPENFRTIAENLRPVPADFS
jgi:hypothetical protein